MKKLLFPTLFSIVFFSCNSSTPKDTAQEFIKALSTADIAKAAMLSSTATKAVIKKAKKDNKLATSAEESFQLTLLKETISGTQAEVKNRIIQVPLIKEKDGWKVVLSEKLINEIQGREERLATARIKWAALLKEYEGRLLVLKDYIAYKKNLGVLSPKVQALSNLVGSFTAENDWTNEKLLLYVQKQKQLNNFIDEALEPSLAANSDLSLNYFLQLSHAGDRIQSAESSYQQIAQQAHSPVYVPLPFHVNNYKK